MKNAQNENDPIDEVLFCNAIRSLTFKHAMSNKATYSLPKLTTPPKPKKNSIILVASGDLRLAANQACAYHPLANV